MEVNFYGGAAEAAGSKTVSLDLGAVTGTQLVTHLTQANQRLARVMSCCSLLVDGLAVHDLDQPLGGAERVDVLPPFSGG